LKDIFLKNFDFLEAKNYVLAGFLLFIGFGSFQSILSGEYEYYDYSIIIKSITLSVLGLFLFMLGYNSQLGVALSKTISFPKIDIQITLLFILHLLQFLYFWSG